MNDRSPTSVFSDLGAADVWIITSGGMRIPAHRYVLASSSPVLGTMADRPVKGRSSDEIVRILGVPCRAVAVFIRFLYASRPTKNELKKYGIHLLALSHTFVVPELKKTCTKALVDQRLRIDNVVDFLYLARQCDAPDLYVKCMKLVYKNFKSVEKTEGWKFIRDHDPWLELEIIQLVEEIELRKRRAKRQRVEQSLYLLLGEAMERLEHICTEGCLYVGPHDVGPTRGRGPCSKFDTCRGLQLLIKHFASCELRAKAGGGGCARCNRMWQLLRLHSSICDHLPAHCKVPLCRRFKTDDHHHHQKKKDDDGRWELLVRKVLSAKAICSLSRSAEAARENVNKTSC